MSVQPVVDALPLLGCTVRDVRRTRAFGRNRSVRLAVETPTSAAMLVLSAVVAHAGGVEVETTGRSLPVFEDEFVATFSFPYHLASELLSLDLDLNHWSTP